MTSSARFVLQREYAALRKTPRSNFFTVYDLRDDNIFEWVVYLIAPSETPFEGGVFKAIMRFPESYPMQPPSLQFVSAFHHPNVFRDGKVCISTLQAPPPGLDVRGSDVYWRPVLGAEQALLSVVSLIGDPNCNDPANPIAAQEFTENRELFCSKVRILCQRSREQLPADFVWPKVAPVVLPQSTEKSVCPRSTDEYGDPDDDEEYVYSDMEDQQDEELTSGDGLPQQQQQQQPQQQQLCWSPTSARSGAKVLPSVTETLETKIVPSKETDEDFVIVSGTLSAKRPFAAPKDSSEEDCGAKRVHL